MKNRIINGAMVIDQRNAGASVTPTNTQYTTDRWMLECSQNSKFTAQQNAGAVTPPMGFVNYLGFTTSSAYALTASDYFWIEQRIEGFNTSDLGWGTANAKTVTLSFWVYSSLTGTFGASISNGATNRIYGISYSIPVANTWTQISVTIAGDTTGTWLTTNGIGIRLMLSLGSGSSFTGTTGAWGSTDVRGGPTGSVSVVGTSGATFYITGVQLEVGSSATGFEYRQYGQELALCQRYYETLFGASAQTAFFIDQYTNGTNLSMYTFGYKVQKRAVPTVSVVGSITTSNTSGAIVLQPSTDGLVAFYSPAGAGRVYWYNAVNSGFTYSAEL
jgi:hypothetical protein